MVGMICIRYIMVSITVCIICISLGIIVGLIVHPVFILCIRLDMIVGVVVATIVSIICISVGIIGIICRQNSRYNNMYNM